MKRPSIGAGAIVIKGNKILLAKRKGSHSEGQWGSMGGHVELGETPQVAAIREAAEELDIIIGKLEYLCSINFFVEGKHYIDIGFKAEILTGTPKPNEPDKIEKVEWFPLDAMPENIFKPINIYLEAMNSNQKYFEVEE